MSIAIDFHRRPAILIASDRKAEMLDHRQRAALVGIARSAVEKAVRAQKPELPVPGEEALTRPAGAFVTLRCQGELRGCIGLVEPTLPLWQTVQQASASAATEDYRFSPISAEDLPRLRLEISVLSPLEKVQDLTTIQVGLHGLVAERGTRRGLLLPQVPREWGWEREEFLSHTCEKAGLPPLAWQEGAAIYRFTAEIFGEEEDVGELYLHLNHAEALRLLQRHLCTPNLIKHCLAAEVVLKQVAQSLEEDAPQWKLCGLVHDIDCDLTANAPRRHTLVGTEILLREGINGPLTEAVKGHNDLAPRESLLAKALWAADPLTGLIVAAALVAPSKRLAAVDVGFVMNRMKEKSFARNVNREQIASCEQLGLNLEKFVSLGLEAMQQIAPQLEL